MSDALSKTFQVLASSTNPRAIEVLIRALDLEDENVRTHSLQAILKRNGLRGHVEVLRRLNTFAGPTRGLLRSVCTELGPAVRHCLAHGDSELRKNALDIVREGDGFDQIPTLIDLLKENDPDTCRLELQTFHALVDQLYGLLYGEAKEPVSSSRRKNAERAVEETLAHLQEACSNLAKFSDAQTVVESVLILGNVDDQAVKYVLWQSDPECRDLASHLLMTSYHPGAMQLLIDFLSLNYPHRSVFEAVAEREDLEFVLHLLRWFPEQLSRVQAANLNQVQSIRWLEDPYRLPLSLIPRSLQPSLIAFISATGMPLEERRSLQEWILQHGSAEGKEAVTGDLSDLDDATIHKAVVSGLEDEDPEVQAWATRHLRSQGIKDAVALLIERLDSPLPAVQEAAREELNNFDLDRFLMMFEQLPPEACARAGQLLQKIDPDVLLKLRRELASPIQWRRIRAAQAALATNLHTEVFSGLTALLRDNSPVVRRTVVDVLASVPTAASVQALQLLTNDSSPRVRESVARALQKIRETGLNAVAESQTPAEVQPGVS